MSAERLSSCNSLAAGCGLIESHSVGNQSATMEERKAEIIAKIEAR